MSWFNSQLKSSLLALLSTDVISLSSREDRTEEIRQWMLDELADAGEFDLSLLARRVRYALDAQALWYTRGDVMAALAAMHGEAVAREKISQITQKFRGLLPKGLNSSFHS